MSERILLVDDEPSIVSALQRLLRHGLKDPSGSAYRIDGFTDARAALAHASEVGFALAISDYRMPEINGVDFLLKLRVIQPNCGRIILSGYADLNAIISAVNEAGISRFVSKPWRDFDLLSAVQQVLLLRDLSMENQRLADEVRLQRGVLSAQEAELQRLECLEPGITKVRWGEDGSFILEDLGGNVR